MIPGPNLEVCTYLHYIRLPAFLSGTAIGPILMWLLLYFICFYLGYQHTNIFRYCILRSTFASSVCLNFHLGLMVTCLLYRSSPWMLPWVSCHYTQTLDDAIWPHVIPQKEIKVWVCPVLMCSSFSALQCGETSPVTLHFSLPSRCYNSSCCFFLVSILQQIICCYIRLPQNTAHLCPDNPLAHILHYLVSTIVSVSDVKKKSANTVLKNPLIPQGQRRKDKKDSNG